jgi:hypothetical protein
MAGDIESVLTMTRGSNKLLYLEFYCCLFEIIVTFLSRVFSSASSLTLVK